MAQLSMGREGINDERHFYCSCYEKAISENYPFFKTGLGVHPFI